MPGCRPEGQAPVGEADFAATCRVSRECGFSKIHIFPFSPRKGTPAAEMSDQVAPQVKQERCERLAELEAELRRAYFQSLVGRRLVTLVEEASDGREGGWVGTSCRYTPVELPAAALTPGQLVPSLACGVRDDRLLATC